MNGALSIHVTVRRDRKMYKKLNFVTMLSVFVTLVVSATFLPCVANPYVIPEGGIDFGDVTVNDTKALTVGIENTSNQVIFPHFELSQATCDAGHFWVTPPPGELLLPGIQVKIQVHFEAGAVGTCSTTLLIKNFGTLLEEITVTAAGLDIGGGGMIVIGGMDTHVVDQDYEGASISTAILRCEENPKNHGDFVSCVSHVVNDLKKESVITEEDATAIKRVAARSQIP
jgi:hypothetical protein